MINPPLNQANTTEHVHVHTVDCFEKDQALHIKMRKVEVELYRSQIYDSSYQQIIAWL